MEGEAGDPGEYGKCGVLFDYVICMGGCSRDSLMDAASPVVAGGFVCLLTRLLSTAFAVGYLCGILLTTLDCLLNTTTSLLFLIDHGDGD